MLISRKKFLLSTFTISGAVFMPKIAMANDEERLQIDTVLVKEFAGTAHRNKDPVVEMHKINPAFLNTACLNPFFLLS